MQKSNPFSRAAQNELAKELYGMGFFEQPRADTVLAVLELMEFEGKVQTVERIRQNEGMYQQIMAMQQTIERISRIP